MLRAAAEIPFVLTAPSTLRPLYKLRPTQPPNLLLFAHGPTARPLAGARVGVGTLPTGGQAAPMTQATVAADVHKALDIAGDVTAEVALHLVVRSSSLRISFTSSAERSSMFRSQLTPVVSRIFRAVVRPMP